MSPSPIHRRLVERSLAGRYDVFLGLGAGTLTQACLKFLPLEDVEVIELRPDVPRLAMEYLGLTDDPRLYVRIGDALELLDSAEPADLIFVDLYTDQGPGVDHLPHGVDHQIRLHGLDVVLALAGNDVLGAWHECRQFILAIPPDVLLIG